jgi:hypothetical protein
MVLIGVVTFGTVAVHAWADDEFRVTVGAANIRQQPTTNSPVITSVPMDTRLTVLGHAGRWVKVQVPDRSGATAIGFILETLGSIEASVDSASSRELPTPGQPRTLEVPDQGGAPPSPPVVVARQPDPSAVGVIDHPPEPVPVTNPSRNTVAYSALHGFLLEGGVVTASGTVGGVVGAGAFIFPFDNDEIAVEVDGHFRQFNSVGGFYGSGNLVQYFRIPDLPFTPFAGAGVPVFRSAGGIRPGVQVVFGFDGARMGPVALGAQIRTSFVSGGPVTLLLAHVSFQSNRPTQGPGH